MKVTVTGTGPTVWFTLLMVQLPVPLEFVGAAVVQVWAVEPLPRTKVSVRPTTGVAPESEVRAPETVRF